MYSWNLPAQAGLRLVPFPQPYPYPQLLPPPCFKTASWAAISSDTWSKEEVGVACGGLIVFIVCLGLLGGLITLRFRYRHY